MTRDDILSLLERQRAAWAAHDPALFAAGYAPQAIVTSPTGGVLEGREEIERVARKWFHAFPDIRFVPEEVLVDGNRVLQIARVSGTHGGEFFGVPATGRKVDVVFALIMTVADGLITEERRILDFTGVLVQVGVLKTKPAGGL
jgi:uncharacterized protein (TIGR02246 family)